MGDDMTDSIRLFGIEVFAHHGVHPEEQNEGQVFLVDVLAELDLSEAGLSDRLETTLDYGTLAGRIRDRVAGERWNLIERVAERVAELVLEDDRVGRVVVTVHKPSAPIAIPVADVAVTVERSS